MRYGSAVRVIPKLPEQEARAAAIAAYRLGLVENRVNVNQPGGMIQIDIRDDGTMYMTGSVGYIADVRVAESFFS